MTKIIKRIKTFMEADEWHPEQDQIEGLDRAFTRFASKEGSWNFVVLVDEETKVVTFYSVLDTLTPEDKRLEMAQFITRANFGLRVGKFELDWEDGIVRFQSGLILEDTELTEALIVGHAERAGEAPPQKKRKHIGPRSPKGACPAGAGEAMCGPSGAARPEGRA